VAADEAHALVAYQVGLQKRWYLRVSSTSFPQFYLRALLAAKPGQDILHLQPENYYKELLGILVHPRRMRKHHPLDELEDLPRRAVRRRRAVRPVGIEEPLADAIEDDVPVADDGGGEAVDSDIGSSSSSSSSSSGSSDTSGGPGGSTPVHSPDHHPDAAGSGGPVAEPEPPPAMPFGRKGKGESWPDHGLVAGLFKLVIKAPTGRASSWEMQCHCHYECNKNQTRGCEHSPAAEGLGFVGYRQ
jgi:hypothetical protein